MQRPTLPTSRTDTVRATTSRTIARLREAFGQELSRATGERASSEMLEAICGPAVTKDEVAEVARRVGGAAGDPIAALLAMRLERQLSRGADPARRRAILVARSRRAREAGGLDLQIAAVLAAIQLRLSGASDEVPLLVLAHESVLSRLRTLLAPGAKTIAGVVRFEDEAALGEPTPGIEILEAQEFVDEFDQRLTTSLKTTTILKPDPAPTSKRSGSLRLGELFHGKYRILRRLGGGGFGVVYEAQDERGVKNRVAIKVLRSDAAELGPEQLEGFREEARRLTRLDHAHIVNWKSFDEAEDGTLYLVMEFVDGEELDKLLKKSPDHRLPARRVQKLLLQMLDALRAAHDVGEGQGILHLDLKPNNVFVVPGRNGEDNVKLIDFGIGQFVGGEAAQPVGSRAGDTSAPTASLDAPQGTLTLGRMLLATATVPGVRRVEACTPEYAAPELCRHVLGDSDIVALDGRADLYSLGVMAYQMLTGRLPYPPVESRYDVVRQHVVADAGKVGASGVRVPRDLARFVDKLLARDREQRWRSADEAWRELDAIVRPPAWKIGLRVAAVVAVVAAGTAWLTRPDSRTPVRLWSVAANGDVIEADREPIHLGPERKSARLRLDAPGIDDWSGLRRTPLHLETPSGVALPPSWSVAWSDAGRSDEIVVNHNGSTGKREEVRARIAGELGDLWLGERAVKFVWLGEEAWSLPTIVAGSTILLEDEEVSVDPEGLELVARVAGDGVVPADIEAAQLELGPGSQPLRMRPSTDTIESVGFAVALPSAWTGGPSVEATIAIQDRAGRSISARRKLRFVTGGLEVQVRLLDAARGPEAPAVEVARSTRGSLLTPKTRPELEVTSNRPVKASVTVLVNGSVMPAPRRDIWKSLPPEDGLQRMRADLAELLGDLPDEATGEIQVALAELGTIRSERSSRGKTERALPFYHSVASAGFEVTTDRGVLGSEPVFTNATSVRVQLATDSSLKFVARWRLHRTGPPGEPDWKTVAGSLFTLPGFARHESFVVELPDAGKYRLEIAAHRTVGSDTAQLEAAEFTTTHELIVVRTSPVLAWSAPALPHEVGDRSRLEASCAVEVRAGDDPDGRAPLDELLVRLVRTNGAEEIQQIRRESAKPGDRFTLFGLFGDVPISDGHFALVAEATDKAGNAAKPLRHDFEISLEGPALEATLLPLPVSTWERETKEGGWRIRVRITDPNGIDVGSIRAVVIEQDGPTAGRQLDLALALDQEIEGNRRIDASGLVPFDETWSAKTVRIEILAQDLRGTPSGKLVVATKKVGDTRRYLPERVVPLTAPAPGPAMRHVPGNADAEYTFGGRGDDVEIALFRTARLGSFKDGRGERSFQLGFGPGAIADFYLDEDEVTRAEFQAFVRAGKSGYLDQKLWPPGARADPARHAAWSAAASAGKDDRLPVTGVTWEEAAAFARWMGKRLPSLVEWEYAVRGGAGRYRPYSAFDPDAPRDAHELVNFRGQRDLAGRAPWPRASGTEESGDGLRDLSGNVREWTSTPRDVPGSSESEPRALMTKYKDIWLDPRKLGERLGEVRAFYAAGGAFDTQYCDFLTWWSGPRTEARANVGFRCAQSADAVRSGLDTRWGAVP